MSNYFDNSHLAEIGEEYELFVGAYCEKVLKCYKVLYNGIFLGKKDGGIDLVAFSKDDIFLIQCKNYSPWKKIYEDTVNQLGGSVQTFCLKHPCACNIKALIVSTVPFSKDAIVAAEANDVGLIQLTYSKKTVGDHLVYFGENVVLDKLSLYFKHQMNMTQLATRSPNIFVKTLTQYPDYSPAEAWFLDYLDLQLWAHAKKLKITNQEIKIDSIQIAPELNQIPSPADQIPLETNPTIFRDESSSASINQVLTPSEAFDNDIMASSEKMSPEEKDAVERGFFYYWWHYDSKSTVSAKNMLKNAFLKLLALSGIIAGIIIAICIFCIPVIGPAIVIIFVVALIVALRNNKPA